jgi:hypothetical protein
MHAAFACAQWQYNNRISLRTCVSRWVVGLASEGSCTVYLQHVISTRLLHACTVLTHQVLEALAACTMSSSSVPALCAQRLLRRVEDLEMVDALCTYKLHITAAADTVYIDICPRSLAALRSCSLARSARFHRAGLLCYTQLA